MKNERTKNKKEIEKVEQIKSNIKCFTKIIIKI